MTSPPSTEHRPKGRYETAYQTEDYFRYRPWLYRPYINAVMQKAGVGNGDSVLDVGCGQGFFSSLLGEPGRTVLGVDLSEAAVRAAASRYGTRNVSFRVADVRNFPSTSQYDCVFARSLSLYNTPDFAINTTTTDVLIEHVRPRGALVFLYATRVPPAKARSWTHHSVSEARAHFAKYKNAEVYFSLRFETLLFGSHSLRRLFTALNQRLSACLRQGGELVCIVRR